MKLHWFQHVPFEGLGSVAEWVVRNGHDLTCTRYYLGETAPGPESYDWLIVMGGPMNVDEHEAYPWLEGEKAAIRAALEAGKTVLGICLGAQLISRACGAEVKPSGTTELGWSPVTTTEAARQHPVLDLFPVSFPALHWHGDRFELPEGATLLGGSQACDHQGYALADRVVGLQFHLELRAGDLGELASQGIFESEQGKGPFVDPAEKILAESVEAAAVTGPLMNALLDRLAEKTTEA